MSYLSICVPTMRCGGLDITLAGLRAQTFRDFELVIADGLYRYRSERVGDEPLLDDFRVRHVEPFANPFPVASFCRYANTALAHASGEVVVFITDYTLMPPNCLEKHAAFHRENPGQGLMGPHVYHGLPPIREPFPGYGGEDLEAIRAGGENEGIDRYVDDLEAGVLDDVMWSIGEEDASLDTRSSNFVGRDPKLGLPAGPVNHLFFHGKNESVARQALLDVNGWDEDLDGSHGWQDSDLADRLTTKGIQWTLDPSIPVRILNPRPVFPFPRYTRPIRTNEAIWQRKKAEGYPPVNTWRLDNPDTWPRNA